MGEMEVPSFNTRCLNVQTPSEGRRLYYDMEDAQYIYGWAPATPAEKGVWRALSRMMGVVDKNLLLRSGTTKRGCVYCGTRHSKDNCPNCGAPQWED